MVRMMVIANVRPEKRKEFLDAMRSLQKDRLKEQGIIGSQVYEDPEDPTRLSLVDEWETYEDLQMYLSKQSYRILLGALRTLCTKAEVKYGSHHGEIMKGTLANFSQEEGRFGKL